MEDNQKNVLENDNFGNQENQKNQEKIDNFKNCTSNKKVAFCVFVSACIVFLVFLWWLGVFTKTSSFYTSGWQLNFYNEARNMASTNKLLMITLYTFAQLFFISFCIPGLTLFWIVMSH